MTTPRKTAQEIADLMVSQLETSFSQAVPLLPKAFIRVMAKVCGLAFVALFQFAGFIALQMVVKYASDREFTVGGITYNPLNEWGALAGLTRGVGARSEGTITVTVLSPGGTLYSGTALVNAETEQTYITVGDVTITAGAITATVRAGTYSEAADLDVSMVLSFVSAPANLEKDTVVATVTVAGADPEDTEDWRGRIMQFFAARPQGGAYADYWEWGNEVEGVANIYPFSGGTPAIPTSGPGQVDVYVKADVGDGTAGAPLLASVEDAIELNGSTGLASRRPVNAYVNVASIYLTTMDAVVAGLYVDPGEVTATRADIEEALENYLLNRENYIVGISYPPRRDIVMASEAAGVAARVAAANGGYITGLTLSIGGTPYDIYSLNEGEQVRIGTVSWT
jgi:uncharacterized phage protein gp47/JayE